MKLLTPQCAKLVAVDVAEGAVLVGSMLPIASVDTATAKDALTIQAATKLAAAELAADKNWSVQPLAVIECADCA